jgi:hypothetical protein
MSETVGGFGGNVVSISPDSVKLPGGTVPIDDVRFGWSGGGGGPMEPQVLLKDYVDKGDEATIAKAEMLVSQLSAKLDRLPTKGTVWTAMGTGIGILLGVAALAADRFDAGVTVGPTISRVETEQSIVDSRQDSAVAELNRKLDVLIERSDSDVKPTGR